MLSRDWSEYSYSWHWDRIASITFLIAACIRPSLNSEYTDQSFLSSLDICSDKLRDWNCRCWCWVHSCYWSLSLSAVLFLFLFFVYYPALNPLELGPLKVAGNNTIEMEFGSNNLRWLQSLEMELENCLGKVIVFRGTNCSILAEARTKEKLDWPGTLPKYFLEGSSLKLSRYNHTVLILKSLAAYDEYMRWCKDLKDVGDYSSCRNIITISCLCHEKSSLPPLLRINETFWCLYMMNLQVFNYDIEKSDFYFVFVVTSFKSPVLEGTAYSYNRTLVSSLVNSKNIYSEGKEVYNSTTIVKARSILSFSISGQFPFRSRENCIVLQTACRGNCNRDCDIYNVTYFLERGHGVLVFPSLFFVLSFVLGCVVSCFHVIACRYRQGGSVMDGQDLENVSTIAGTPSQ